MYFHPCFPRHIDVAAIHEMVNSLPISILTIVSVSIFHILTGSVKYIIWINESTGIKLNFYVLKDVSKRKYQFEIKLSFLKKWPKPWRRCLSRPSLPTMARHVCLLNNDEENTIETETPIPTQKVAHTQRTKQWSQKCNQHPSSGTNSSLL